MNNEQNQPADPKDLLIERLSQQLGIAQANLAYTQIQLEMLAAEYQKLKSSGAEVALGESQLQTSNPEQTA